MDLQGVFGDFAVSKFIDEHLHRLPLALAGTAASMRGCGSWDALDAMLRCPDADVLAVRGGEPLAGDPPRDAEAARALCGEGYTLRVRHAERHHAGVAELARAFEAAFRAAVDVQAFATPAGRPGFSWHYDAEDVFILQTAGAKEYSLRKNTVNPWPLEETLPADMRYEREVMPLMRVRLAAGDLLYIPCGWWHKAEAQAGEETAISLAVGVMSRSAMDLYDFLRPKLVESLVWRQRLPVGEAEGDETVAGFREAMERLAAEFAKVVCDPRVAREFWERGVERGARHRDL
jgi:ribosomal protein L16 Arg81 hydroxylase